jgi:hypothetical protein
MMTADSVVGETEVVGLFVKVVRLRQLSQKPAAIAGERAAGEELLDCRPEARRPVPSDPAKDGLTVVAKVRAE